MIKMAEIKRYEYHPLANIFPLMEGEEFESFVVDVDKHGLLNEIILFEDKILDGRNRDRVCIRLGIPGKYKNLPKGMSALDYIISQNLRRRHLNKAQRAEIGLILLKEEEKRTKERQAKIASEVGKMTAKGQGKSKSLSKTKKNVLLKKIDEIKEEFGEGKSVEIVAPKVKISSTTLEHAKKIKKVAEGYKDKKGVEHPPEPIIAQEWEEAKKGETTISAVYKKVQIIEKLPEDLKKEIRKEKPKITFKEAKEIAEFPKPEQRKIVMEKIKKTKQTIKQIIKEEKEIAGKKKPMPIMKKIDIDKKKIDKMQTIFFQITQEYTVRDIQDYNEITQKKCIEIMRKVYQFIFNEMEKYGKRPI